MGIPHGELTSLCTFMTLYQADEDAPQHHRSPGLNLCQHYHSPILSFTAWNNAFLPHFYSVCITLDLFPKKQRVQFQFTLLANVLSQRIKWSQTGMSYQTHKIRAYAWSYRIIWKCNCAIAGKRCVAHGNRQFPPQVWVRVNVQELDQLLEAITSNGIFVPLVYNMASKPHLDCLRGLIHRRTKAVFPYSKLILEKNVH